MSALAVPPEAVVTYNTEMQGAPVRVGNTLAEMVRCRAEAAEYGEGDPATLVAARMACDRTGPR